MTLNSEGLEKARCATDGCGRPATQRFEAGGVGSDHCDDCAKKIRRLSALPPVDGLEVVGHVKPEHPEAVEPLFVRELAEPWMEGIFTIPVVSLSQASSVIEGLKEVNEALMRERTSLIDTKREQIERLTKERDDARKAFDGLSATTGKIVKERSSLEEEIKRLREALKQQIPGHRDPEGDCWCRYGHNPDYGHTLSCVAARQALEDHNG